MATTQVFTKTDSAPSEWAIDDDVVHLREWGAGKVHTLPPLPVDDWTIGTAESCSLRLEDPSLRASRLHARVIRGQSKWLIRDNASKNGMQVDGALRSESALEPGLEIGIGGVTLIAESLRSIALRSFLERLLGWGGEHAGTVDLALRSVRLAATRRVALVLRGDGDLVPTALSLHHHSRGADRPFIVCDPRRQRRDANVRSSENYRTGMEAFAAATGGTICVRSRRMPPDLRELLEALRAPNSRVQLVVCAEAHEDCERYCVPPIEIPPLSHRLAELDRIIDAYANDAVTELALPRSEFLPSDRAWVREHASTSLPEIEKATLRLVAIRASRTLTNAAARLGMAPVSLSRWIGRRRMPMQIVE